MAAAPTHMADIRPHASGTTHPARVTQPASPRPWHPSQTPANCTHPPPPANRSPSIAITHPPQRDQPPSTQPPSACALRSFPVTGVHDTLRQGRDCQSPISHHHRHVPDPLSLIVHSLLTPVPGSRCANCTPRHNAVTTAISSPRSTAQHPAPYASTDRSSLRTHTSAPALDPLPSPAAGPGRCAVRSSPSPRSSPASALPSGPSSYSCSPSPSPSPPPSPFPPSLPSPHIRQSHDGPASPSRIANTACASPSGSALPPPSLATGPPPIPIPAVIPSTPLFGRPNVLNFGDLPHNTDRKRSYSHHRNGRPQCPRPETPIPVVRLGIGSPAYQPIFGDSWHPPADQNSGHWHRAVRLPDPPLLGDFRLWNRTSYRDGRGSCRDPVSPPRTRSRSAVIGAGPASPAPPPPPPPPPPSSSPSPPHAPPHPASRPRPCFPPRPGVRSGNTVQLPRAPPFPFPSLAPTQAQVAAHAPDAGVCPASRAHKAGGDARGRAGRCAARARCVELGADARASSPRAPACFFARRYWPHCS
ncbi:hypothetical protein AcV7_005855 [Taiwanofungus camphoratus]|nr:hypothetical protein AcV7_005855 [Antrodia cinnamomea]